MSDDAQQAVIEDLWRYYEVHAQHARQHETLRAQATSILSAIAAGVGGIAGIGGLSAADIPAGLIVMGLSVLGVAISLKHYERSRFHSAVLAAARSPSPQRVRGRCRSS